MNSSPLCPTCGTIVPPGARFCENDGTRLVAPDAATTAIAPGVPPVEPWPKCRCGAVLAERDASGYCQTCGRVWPSGPPADVAGNPLRLRDHIAVEVAPGFALVTDRGLVHDHNQDDGAIAAAGGASILVVCDGISSAYQAAAASRAAAVATLGELRLSTEHGAWDPPTSMRAALLRAHHAVCDLHHPDVPASVQSPPATTIVAALAREQEITIGWLGDSRAYWVGAPSALGEPPVVHPLTTDHSWVNEVVAAGQMSEADALHSKLAHAVTRFLGPQEDGMFAPLEPGIMQFTIRGPGYLVLCTDGLWNYAPSPEEFAELVKPAPGSALPEVPVLKLCERLVKFVLARGARDNVTVAIEAFGG